MPESKHRCSSGWSPLEMLEPRWLLSVTLDTGPVNEAISREIVEISWNGQAVQAAAGEWLVRYNSPFTDDVQARLSDALFAIDNGTALRTLGQGNFGLIRSAKSPVDDILAWASSQADIAYIEPNFSFTIQTVPDDPRYGDLWALNNTGQSGGTPDADIDALEAWDITTGSSDVVVAVIDTGIDYSHPDLIDNMWINPGEIADDGIDNDGNGYVDDIYGYDFANDDADPFDDNSHGTHVAGTIGAVGNNAAGVTGINWDASIMALKFLRSDGNGYVSDAIEAIDYATMMRRDYGVNVVASNNSWGGGGLSQGLYEAIARADEQDILFVAAAGNDGDDTDETPHYPSAYDLDNIISVGGSDRNDGRPSWSNFGAVSVDLAAPGASILSTTPNGGYGTKSGTSMASPHVAGVLALLAASDPDASALQIKHAILNAVDPINSWADRSVTGGRLNAYNALQTIATQGPLVYDVIPQGEGPPVDHVDIRFSEALDPATVDAGHFILQHDGADDLFDTADDVFFVGTPNLPEPDHVRLSLADDLPGERYRLTIVGDDATPIQDEQGFAFNGGIDYQHTFTILEGFWPFEPNDVLDDAVPLPIDTVGSATIDAYLGDGYYANFDVDLHSIDLIEGYTLITDINAASQGSPLDSILRIFNEEGVQLVVNDDESTLTLDSYIKFTAPETGTYYIGVSGYFNFLYDPFTPDSGFTQTLGDYSLVVTATSNQPYENNDTLAAAFETGITSGGLQSQTHGHFDAVVGDGAHSELDVDFFAFNANPGDHVLLSLSGLGVGQELDAFIQLFDGAGNAVASSGGAQAGGVPTDIAYDITEAGQYVVAVSGAGNVTYDPHVAGSGQAGALGNYRLTVTLDPPSARGDITGIVWHDRDGDGEIDPDEEALPDKPVYVDYNGNGLRDAGTTLEPDNFTDADVLNDILPGIQLTAIGVDMTEDVVRSELTSVSSTGSRAFSNVLGGWSQDNAELRVDFMETVGSVSIDFISDDQSDYGQLQAFDRLGELLDTYTTAELSTEAVETMTVASDAHDIAYVVAYALGNDLGVLDNLAVSGGRFSDPISEASGHNYLLSDVLEGNRTVRLLPEDDWEQTFPVGDAGQFVTVSDEGAAQPPAFGVRFTGTQVVGRYIFYNNSAFDDETKGRTDDDAIASDKVALRPGQTATGANYTSYSRGINGVMVDILNPASAFTLDDFEFRVGNDGDPDNWSAAPLPQSMTIRPGDGVHGSTRVSFSWADNHWWTNAAAEPGSIANQWIMVITHANTNTALDQPDVFFFGNAIGDTLNSSTQTFVDATDRANARNNQKFFLDPALIDDLHDFNRDTNVDATDRAIARENQTFFLNDLNLISVPSDIAIASGELIHSLSDLPSQSSISARSTIPSTGREFGNAGNDFAPAYALKTLKPKASTPLMPEPPSATQPMTVMADKFVNIVTIDTTDTTRPFSTAHAIVAEPTVLPAFYAAFLTERGVKRVQFFDVADDEEDENFEMGLGFVEA